MKDQLTKVLTGLVIIALIVGAVIYEASIWKECRAQHSWGYCVRLISK